MLNFIKTNPDVLLATIVMGFLGACIIIGGVQALLNKIKRIRDSKKEKMTKENDDETYKLLNDFYTANYRVYMADSLKSGEASLYVDEDERILKVNLKEGQFPYKNLYMEVDSFTYLTIPPEILYNIEVKGIMKFSIKFVIFKSEKFMEFVDSPEYDNCIGISCDRREGKVTIFARYNGNIGKSYTIATLQNTRIRPLYDFWSKQDGWMCGGVHFIGTPSEWEAFLKYFQILSNYDPNWYNRHYYDYDY